MKEAIYLFFIFFFSSILFIPSLSTDPCRPDSCHPTLGPVVRFPFRLQNRQPDHCGYTGFDLTCNNQSQTIINLPLSGEFVVNHIDYAAQALFINDPGSCLPNRLLNFTMPGLPFQGANMRSYTFMNCSSNYLDYGSTQYMPLFCLSGRNYTVLAMNTWSASSVQLPSTCVRITSVVVPLQLWFRPFYSSPMGLNEDLELVWNDQVCRECENRGGFCGFRGDSHEIGCTRPSGSRRLPRSAKYGIIIGVGIPGLLCIIGLACYACGLVRASNIRRNLNSESIPITVSNNIRGPAIRSTSGLDLPTIESYPKTVLGESRRLPEPSCDGTCPICLSDYEPKETLRSLPECIHYFHADCIDEWLKLNGTCPLCRNSPESSVATPFSSTPLSSSSSSTSDHH